MTFRATIKGWQDMPAMGGGITQTFDAGQPAWAKREPLGNAIFFGTKQVDEAVTDRFIIRRTPALTDRTITGEHVIEGEGQRFRVKRVSALNGGNKFVVIEAELIGNV
ncbi:MAG: head-tail adaptor protein [Sulfuritalea sp.]|nr:head-tail adaptor protein [Sulfuritalea sp.]